MKISTIWSLTTLPNLPFCLSLNKSFSPKYPKYNETREGMRINQRHLIGSKVYGFHDSLTSILEQNMNNIMVGCKVHTKEFKSIHVTIESNLHTYHNNDE